jgi:hypothetical protein
MCEKEVSKNLRELFATGKQTLTLSLGWHSNFSKAGW